MSKQKQQPKIVSLPKALEDKILARQKRTQERKPTQEYLIIATLGLSFGWEAIKDLLGIGCIDHGDGTKPCECISWALAEELMKAITSIDASNKVELAQITATATIAANSKSPDKVMQKLINRYKERI